GAFCPLGTGPETSTELLAFTPKSSSLLSRSSPSRSTAHCRLLYLVDPAAAGHRDRGHCPRAGRRREWAGRRWGLVVNAQTIRRNPRRGALPTSEEHTL